VSKGAGKCSPPARKYFVIAVEWGRYSTGLHTSLENAGPSRKTPLLSKTTGPLPDRVKTCGCRISGELPTGAAVGGVGAGSRCQNRLFCCVQRTLENKETIRESFCCCGRLIN